MSQSHPGTGRVAYIRPYFRWYDMWMGLYWDRTDKCLYIGYLPMLGIKIAFYYIWRNRER